MKERALAFGRKLWGDFKGFSTGQKAATIAAVLALLVGGIVFTQWKSTPAYAPLYTNLAPADASAIIDKLNTSGTPYELAANGTSIMVPKDEVYTSRIALSAEGLPNSSQSGYDLLNNESVTTSEFKQQVDYQVAVQTELNNTIEAINGIQDAAVHLAIPQQDVFNDDTQKPTASVLVTTGAMTQLTTQQVQSIQYLVSSSVPGMSAEDVTISDQNGRVLAARGQETSGAAALAGQDQQEQSYNGRQAAALQSMIDAAVGPGHAKIVYNAQFNWDQQTKQSNEYLYTSGVPPVSEETSTETWDGKTANEDGVLGAEPTPTGTAGSTQGGKYAKGSRTVNNALGTLQTTTKTAPGSVAKQAISVMLDKNAENVDAAAIEDLVKAGVGFDGKRGDTLSVQTVAFDTSAADSALAQKAQADAAAAAAASHDRMVALVKQGVIGAVILAAVVATLLLRRKKRKSNEPPVEPVEEFWYDEPLPDLPPLVDDKPVDDATSEAAARRRALVALADEQPDDVARVLSGWLNSVDR